MAETHWVAAKPQSVLEPHAAIVPVMPRWEGKVKNATLSRSLMGEGRGGCFSQGLAPVFPLHAGRCHCAVGSRSPPPPRDRTPTCRAFQLSIHTACCPRPLRECLPVFFLCSQGQGCCSSSAPLLPAIFRPGDGLFPASVQSSRQSQVLIDDCRGLQGMA